MSSISSVSSNTGPYQPANRNGFDQFVQDFQAIGSALQTGDLSGAQNALATLQQYVQGNSPTSSSQPFGNNSQANSDYQNLVGALQSGNLSNAQQAFSSLQSGLQAAHKGHGHHHHRSSASNSTSSNSTASDPTASDPATSASNPAASFLTAILNVTA